MEVIDDINMLMLLAYMKVYKYIGVCLYTISLCLEFIYIYIYDKFSKVVVDFSSIRGPKLFGWMLIFNLF